MTIESALLSVYPNQVISEPVRLGSKLFLEMDNNALSRDEIGYWVARDNGKLIFSFDTRGVVSVWNDVDLFPHEKRVITRIISMWREFMRPDWETFESMRRRSTAYKTMVPVTHSTL